MVRLLLVLCVALFAVSAVNSKKIDQPGDELVICYLASWAYYRTGDGQFHIDLIDANLCTHAIYGFALLDNMTNNIVYADQWLDIELGHYERFNNLRNTNPNLKTMLAIGGWNEGSEKYSKMVSDPVTRSIFVQSVVSFLKQYNFDGLDIDWEYPANRGGVPEDKENFALLIAELRTEFDKEDWLLSAAIGVGPSVLETAYNFSAMCRDLDFINLMTYDLHGSWDRITGHHTSLYTHPNMGEIGNSLSQSLDVIVALGGCPSKMVLGMAMYGKTYALTNSSETDIGSSSSGDGLPGQFTKQKGMLGYNEICLLSGYEVDRDNYTMAPWAYEGDQWLCYDDVQSIEIKSMWALENGLMGGMIWSIDTDDFRGTCGEGVFPLLAQINRIFTANPDTTTTTNPTTAISTTDSAAELLPSLIAVALSLLLGVGLRT